MKISTKTRYALRLMLDLAQNQGDYQWVSLKDIAERQGVSKKYLEQIVSMLKIMGYDDSVSIEHEDGLMSPKEGLEKAIAFLKTCVITQDNTNMWWA